MRGRFDRLKAPNLPRGSEPAIAIRLQSTRSVRRDLPQPQDWGREPSNQELISVSEETGVRGVLV